MRDHAVAPRAASSIDRERIVVSTIGVLLLLLWLGFSVHRSPRFPGSFSGSMLAIAGAALIVLPSLAYLFVKRITPLKRWVTRRMRLQTLLAWHVYAGIVGAILAIAHTGHRFDSTLGITLTAAMLLTVFSGYVGRHFLRYVSLEVRDQQRLLEELMVTYNVIAGEMAIQPLRLAPADPIARRAYQATEIAASIADLEYSIKSHDMLKSRFRLWLVAHIATSIIFYALLTLHIWAAFYFGLRWLV